MREEEMSEGTRRWQLSNLNLQKSYLRSQVPDPRRMEKVKYQLVKGCT